MDEDDCDIYADVTKFCNNDNLEERINQAEENLEFNEIPVYEFQHILNSPKKVVKKSPIKKDSPEKTASPRRTRSAAKAQENGSRNQNVSNEDEVVNIPEESLQSRVEELSSQRARRSRGSGSTAGTGRGRGRRPRNNLTNCFEGVIAALTNNLNTLPAPPPPGSQRGRARRRYMAELAARSSVVGIVDLVTSPSLPLLNLHTVVSLDSDDECPEANSFDLSFESENPEISVKVRWGDNIETFTHRKYQKFSDLMNIFAKREDVAVSDIVLNLEDRIILPTDTPDSIDYKIYQFISGRIIKNSVLTAAKPRKKNANELNLKIQSDAWKKPILVSLKKQDNFRILYIKCSEELNVPVENIKLSFDGEPLDLDSKPEDLELEGEEIIDCRLIR